MGILREKIIDPLLAFLKQGITPEKLALTLAFGFALGVIPVLGVTTVLCAGAALYFRLNMAAIQLVNYFVYPLQLLFFVPFIKLGELIFNQPLIPFSGGEILSMFREDVWDTLQKIWFANLLGVVAWLIIITPLSILLYYLTLPVFRRFEARDRRRNGVD